MAGIEIPRILGGNPKTPGQAMKEFGQAMTGVGKAAGGVAATIQANYDFINATENRTLWEEERRQATLDFDAKDDGSSPDAYQNYKEAIGKIDKKYVDRGYGFNDNVGRATERLVSTRGAELNGQVQQRLFNRFMDRTVTVQRKETDAQAQRAGATGEFRFELAELDKRLDSMTQLWGQGNVDAEKERQRAYLVESGMNARLTDPIHGPSFIKQLEADPTYQTELYKNIPAQRHDAMNTRIKAAKAHFEALQKQAVHEERERKLMERQEAIDKVNKILVPIALRRNGINRPSDLTPAQWADLTEKAPDYAAKLQDSMRREMDYQARQARTDVREAAYERRMQQADNESLILISDDFHERDLKSDLAAGDISPAQYTRLLAAQERLDPIKRDSVRAALSKVNTGSALGKAIGVKDKNEEAAWKLKYGDLVKAWAYNHADDPDFDRKMTEFVDKQILSDMVTSWFSGDDADRLEKYKKAKGDAGELPKRGKKPREQATKKLVGYQKGKPVYDVGGGKWQVGE